MVVLPTHLRGASTGDATLSRAELAAHQRDRVIASATLVFARRGFQATTVDDILAAAKMGFGNFYSLFEGKEDCFLACFDHAVADARRRMREAGAGAADWAEQTYLELRSLISAILGAPLKARLVLLEAQSAGVAALKRYDALVDATTVWLSAGRPADPSLPQSFEQTTAFGLAYYLQQCVLDPGSHDTETLLAETSTLLLEPLIGSARLAELQRSVGASA